MKKIVLLLAILGSIFLVSCGSTSNDVKNQVSTPSVFTQEEVDFINSVFNNETWKLDNEVISSTCTKAEISYITNEDYTSNGSTTKVKYKYEIVKSNSLYLMKVTDLNNNDTTTLRVELNIERVVNYIPVNNRFIQSQIDAFKTHIASQTITGFTFIDYSGVARLNFIIKNNQTGDWVLDLYIVKQDGKYIALTKDGILATENSLEALYTNSAILAKINEVTSATRSAKSLNKITSETSVIKTESNRKVFNK